MKLKVFILCTLCFLALSLSYAIPPTSANFDCAKVTIIEAEYLSYSYKELPDYFSPPNATYRILNFLNKSKLSTKSVGDLIEIEYSFDSGGSCIKPENWRFSERLLPKAGTRWVLIIEGFSRGAFQTYNGSKGRLNPEIADNRDLIANCLNGQIK